MWNPTVRLLINRFLSYLTVVQRLNLCHTKCPYVRFKVMCRAQILTHHPIVMIVSGYVVTQKWSIVQAFSIGERVLGLTAFVSEGVI